MSKRIRRRFTEEFKPRAVAMVLEQRQSVVRVCTDLDLLDTLDAQSWQPGMPLPGG